jgi:hypothetical protein
VNKPDNIPADIWDTATNCLLGDTGDMDFDISLAIAQAVLGERHRCAMVEASPAIELPGGTYGLAAIEAYWKGVQVTKGALREAIRNPVIRGA